MKNTNREQQNLLQSLVGEITEQKASGLAFSLAVALPYVLVLLFAAVGAVFGFLYKGAEEEDWYLYVGYLLSPISFAIVAVLFFRLMKTPVKSVIGKPTVWDFLLAIIVQFGLFSLGSVNEWFIVWLEKLGLQAPVPQIPSMEGWGFVGVIVVIAVLPAVFEELFFRGVLLRGLRGLPVWASALICGALFSFFHQNPAQTLYQFFCGVAFALIAIRSGSILPTMLAHFCNNAFVLCADKFDWRTNMLPVLIASAVCLVVSVGYLIICAVKTGGNGEEKPDWKGFSLCASAGIFICLIGWVSGLFGV